MGKLLKCTVLATSVSVLSLAFFLNTALVLTTRGYCIVLFTVPFTDMTFKFPNWMCATNSKVAIGTLAMATKAPLSMAKPPASSMRMVAHPMSWGAGTPKACRIAAK